MVEIRDHAKEWAVLSAAASYKAVSLSAIPGARCKHLGPEPIVDHRVM